MCVAVRLGKNWNEKLIEIKIKKTKFSYCDIKLTTKKQIKNIKESKNLRTNSDE